MGWSMGRLEQGSLVWKTSDTESFHHKTGEFYGSQHKERGVREVMRRVTTGT